MIYFDFHTHRIPPSSEVIPVYNRIVYPDPAQEDSIEPGALCSCGIHPWYVLSDGVAQMERLSLLAQEPGVVAIGEAGLDRLAATPWTVQERLFEEQIRLVRDFDVSRLDGVLDALLDVERILDMAGDRLEGDRTAAITSLITDKVGSARKVLSRAP